VTEEEERAACTLAGEGTTTTKATMSHITHEQPYLGICGFVSRAITNEANNITGEHTSVTLVDSRHDALGVYSLVWSPGASRKRAKVHLLPLRRMVMALSVAPSQLARTGPVCVRGRSSDCRPCTEDDAALERCGVVVVEIGGAQT